MTTAKKTAQTMIRDEEMFGWSTVNEKEFLDGLGSHTDHPLLSRKELLISYIKYCTKRLYWGRVSRKESLFHAKKLLADIT